MRGSEDLDWLAAPAVKNPDWALQLMVRSELWMARRVEQLELLDGDVVRRRASLDFVVPVPPGEKAEKEQWNVLPISMGVKRALRGFSISASDGQPVHLYSKRHIEPLTLDVIAAAERLAGVLRGPDPCLAECIVRGPLLAAEGIWQEHISPGPWHDVTKEGLGTFAVSWPMFVGFKAVSGSRAILKLEMEESIGDSHPQVVASDSGWGIQRIDTEERRASTRFQIEVPRIADADSFHVELRVPDGLLLESFELLADDGDDYVVLDLDQPPGGTGTAHVYTSREAMTALGVVPDTVQTAFADAKLILRPGPLLVASWFVPLSVTGVLIVAGYFSWSDEFVRQGETAAAMILIVPAVITAFLGQPNEHPLVQRLSAPFRGVLIKASLIALAAAGTLAITGANPEASEKAHGIRLVVWAVAVVLLISMASHPLRTWLRAKRVWGRQG